MTQRRLDPHSLFTSSQDFLVVSGIFASLDEKKRRFPNVLIRNESSFDKNVVYAQRPLMHQAQHFVCRLTGRTPMNAVSSANVTSVHRTSSGSSCVANRVPVLLERPKARPKLTSSSCTSARTGDRRMEKDCLPVVCPSRSLPPHSHPAHGTTCPYAHR